MRIRVLFCTVSAYGLSCVSWHSAAARSPSFDCNRARFPDEIAICRTPELAELDNIIAAAYAYLKSTRGRAYADQVEIPFWRLRQACQYDTGCIRQVQVQAINAYQAAGAPIVMPQPSMTGAFEATNSQSDPSAELRLCRNSMTQPTRSHIVPMSSRNRITFRACHGPQYAGSRPHGRRPIRRGCRRLHIRHQA